MNDISSNVEELDFSARPQDEQDDFANQTWCNTCMDVDLGMDEVQEFRTNERHWMVGKCLKCRGEVVTEIVYDDD